MSDTETTLKGFEVAEGHKSGFVALAGRPNVGKSTLLNAFMGQKIAIVTPRPQTTRRRQLGILTRPDCQIVFVDTPGLMRPRHKLDEFMVETAVNALEDADVILWLVDVSETVGKGDRHIAAQLAALDASLPIIMGLNKSDLLPPEAAHSRREAYQALLPRAQPILFSALQGRGREELLQMVIDALPQGPRYYDPAQITDVFLRDLAAELVREQLMLQLREEVPYGTAVVVDEFKERDNGVTYIHAVIFTERQNHKQIIIGGGGAQLRELGAAAREEIEQLVGGQVYLDLWVKVVPKWRRKERELARLGYAAEK
jgi:GTP-binding protein Era